MNALARLQASVLTQSAAIDNIAQSLSHNARLFVTAGALAIAALMSSGAYAQNQNKYLTPSNCGAVGAIVGATAGASMGQKSDAQRIIGGAIGGLLGGAAGNWVCSPSEAEPKPGASYNNDAGKTVHKVPLSVSEIDRLDIMAQDAVSSKIRWKTALYNSTYNSSGPSAREAESQARKDFEESRSRFAIVVARLDAGNDSMAPKQVGRYLEISAALLELNTNGNNNKPVSYQMLAAQDERLQSQNSVYREEIRAAANGMKM